ncbi:hypothetical protein HNP73_003141 [Amaricoccus macauensis]|uniref:Uncharacterized protein n=1 Tax=Amaricoccus macauensis TaxID=57001 RepID=A0A840SQ43_9RHOB|nr:hypothetical protein [Amaricoccus macauensis]
MPDPLTEEWHEAVSLLCGLYQASVESIAEDVALLQRKFNYVTLESPIDISSGLNGLWETNTCLRTPAVPTHPAGSQQSTFAGRARAHRAMAVFPRDATLAAGRMT